MATSLAASSSSCQGHEREGLGASGRETWRERRRKSKPEKNVVHGVRVQTSYRPCQEAAPCGAIRGRVQYEKSRGKVLSLLG